MKAVLYLYRRADPAVRFVDDCPDLDWRIVWSAEEAGDAVGDADILVMTNRICTPELGVILNKRITARLNWCITFLPASSHRSRTTRCSIWKT